MQKPRHNIGLQVGNETPEGTAKLVINAIQPALLRAVELGRMEIGVALAQALGKFGSVENIRIEGNRIEVRD